MLKAIFILILLYEIYSQTCFGISSTIPSVCSGAGTCVAQDLCACFSGNAGTQCEIVAASTCIFNGPPQPLVTNYPPSLDPLNTLFSNDTLYLQIDMPLVQGRLATVISINNSPDPACRYPGTYFTDNLNQTGACENEFRAAIPFSVAGANCGWNVTQTFDPISGNVTSQTFSGNIFVTYLEDVNAGGKYRVLRAVRSGLPISINFPIMINQTVLPIVTPVEILSALQNVQFLLGRQIKKKEVFGTVGEPFIPVPNSGILTFVTDLPYPYILLPQTANVISIPTGLSTTGIQNTDNGIYCNSTDIECFQTWSVPLGIQGACSFTGSYVFNFTVGCRTTPCNVTFANPIQLNFSVVTTDFCAQFQINVPLTGTLQSFTNNNFTIPSDNFLTGSPIYLQATVNSPKAQILNTRIMSVSILNSNQLVLYDNGITPAGLNLGFLLLPSTSSDNANFRFILNFLNLPTNPTNLTIQTVVFVQYLSLSDDYTFFDIKEMQVVLDEKLPPNPQTRELSFSKNINIDHLKGMKESSTGSLTSVFLLIILFLLL